MPTPESQEVERISSRDHNAWAELRSALDALKEGK